MAVLGWTKGENRRITAGSTMDVPTAIRNGLINSYGFLISLVVDMLFTEFINFTRKTKLVFCNLQIGGFHSDAMCQTTGLSLENFFYIF
jgi:hypothetical protein